MFSLAFFSQFLKLDDSILGIISCTSKILSAGLYAFATGPIAFYLGILFNFRIKQTALIFFLIGAVVEILSGTSFIAMRALISKLVGPEELGKINSLFGIFEAIVPLIYGPLYSKIYALSIDTLPGCFFLVGGALTVPSLFIF